MISTTFQVKPLDEILAYKNQEVLDRFSKMRPDATAEADLIFDDLKRFLWLVATTEKKRKAGAELPDISFSESMLIIDEMWHAFILYTEYYAAFCDKYLGQFVHHPTAMDKYSANKKNMSEEEASQIFLRELASLVYDSFGEETVERWFDYYFKYQVN
jgi:hypothetical protein